MIEKLNLYFNDYITKRPILFLIGCYLIASLLRVYTTFFVIHPQSLPDEFYYDFTARMFLDGTLFFGSAPYPSQYPPAYPILISIGHILTENVYEAYKLILALNCFISSLIVFPAYAIIKRFASGFYPIAGAIIVLSLPAISASTLMLMSENFFTLLVVLSVYCFIRALDDLYPTIYDVLTGLVIFIAFFTRTSGVVLVVGYVISMAILGYLNRKTPIGKTVAKKFSFGLGAIISLYAIWSIDQILAKGKIPSGYGMPFDQILQIIIHNPLLFLNTFALEIQYLVIASFVIFFVFALYCLYDFMINNESIQRNHHEFSGYLRSIGAFITISSISLFLVGIAFIFGIIQNQMPYMYGRYVDPLTPVLIILGTIGIASYRNRLSLNNRKTRHYFYALTILTTIVCLLIGIQPLPEPNNNSAIYFWYTLIPSLSWAIVAVIPALFAGLFLFLHQKPSGQRIFFLLCFGLAILTSLPIMHWEIGVSQNFAKVLQWNDAITKVTPEGDVIIWEQSKDNDAWDVIAYHALKFWMQDRITRTNLTIIKQEDGRVVISSEGNITGKWILSKTDYPFKKTLDFGEYYLYSSV